MAWGSECGVGAAEGESQAEPNFNFNANLELPGEKINTQWLALSGDSKP